MPRRVSLPPAPCLLLSSIVAAALAGCGPGNVGSSGSGAGSSSGPATTTGDDGADDESHGFEPDAIECSVPTCTNLTSQYDPASCCEGLQPADPDESSCPSETYPNNWTCDLSGNCVHGGCLSDSDCPASMKCLDPEEDADDIGFCLATCEDDGDCGNQAILHLLCTGVAEDGQEDAYEYCRQDAQPE